jgi:addiction module RelB/DinJ family antitoxin
MKTLNDVQITIRVDRNLKERAESLFSRLGMNMSTALNVFLRKAVSEDAIPFAVSAKSPRFVTGYSEDDITNAFQTTVQREIARKKQNGVPVAMYDNETKRAFLEYPDGTREYVKG